MSADVPAYLPWLSLLVAWTCFGSFAVPMKWQSVVDANVHPLVYQGYKTFWTFVTSHAVLLFVPYEFSWWGIVCGICWVPAGIAAVVAVRNVGVAYGQATWQMTIIATSFVWGFLILQDESVSSWPVAVTGVACLVCGIIGMTIAINMRKVSSERCVPACANNDRSERSECCSGNEYQGLGTDKKQVQSRATSVGLGIGAALFNGVWGGSNLVPSLYAPIHGIHFVMSFATGALIVNAAIAALYVVAVGTLRSDPLSFGSEPSLQLRVMALPGFISGTLWSLGNMGALYCVSTIGQGIGNAMIQSSVVLSGLWGILLYREITGRPVVYWCLSCSLCLFGVMLLAVAR